MSERMPTLHAVSPACEVGPAAPPHAAAQFQWPNGDTVTISAYLDGSIRVHAGATGGRLLAIGDASNVLRLIPERSFKGTR